MSTQNTNLKDQVLALLQEAQEKKKTNTAEGIKILLKAGDLLPHLPADNDKRSERNVTQDRGTQEILYLSKRGNILYELKDYKEAGVCYKAIKDVLPNNTQVYKAIGDCFRKQNDHNEAVKQYGQGLQVYERDESSMPAQKAGLLNSRGLAYIGLKDFKLALADFDGAIKINPKNPLYQCNKGQAAYGLGDKDTALNHFKQASELVKSNQLGDLTRNNLAYIEKTLTDLIHELESLTKISLRKADIIMAAREINFVETAVEVLSGSDGAQDGASGDTFIKDQGSQLRDAKKILSQIQEDQPLYEYYDGFMFTLHQSYATAVIVNSGTMVIDTSTKLDPIIKAISLLPLVGSGISEGLTSVKDFVKNAQVVKAASNVCKFATTGIQFDELAQDALCQVVLEKQAKIKALQDNYVNNSLLPAWVKKLKTLVKKIQEVAKDINEYLYGERNETPLQKLGYQAATTLVSDYIASGNIYDGVPAIRIPPAEKGKKLADAARKAIEDSFLAKEGNVAEGPQKVETAARSACCEMF